MSRVEWTRQQGSLNRSWRFAMLIGVQLISLACASTPRLVPERATIAFAGKPGIGGAGRESGVQIRASSEAWRGDPDDLEDDVAPLYLEIENRSRFALWIRYEHIALVTETGRRFEALPPFDVKAEEVTARVPSEPPATLFQIASHHHRFLPRHPRVRGEFPLNESYFQRQHRKLVRLGLPTDDMLEAALPEGLLEPGGRVTGFVYLEDPSVVARPGIELSFEVELTRPPSGEFFGRVRIPFTFAMDEEDDEMEDDDAT